MINIEKYNSNNLTSWNEFVDKSRNGTFLHNRNYLEYHADRFKDYSLILFDNTKLMALLPANIQDRVLISHQGLTYGGLILNPSTTLVKCIQYFYEILKFLHSQEITKLIYKPAPSFYHLLPSDEPDYVLFLIGAKCMRRDSGTVIEMSNKLPFQERRNRSVKKASKLKVEIRQENSYEAFWNKILIPNLAGRHRLKPVHSLDEIELLANYFPDHIKQFSAYINDQIVAGTTIFETHNVAHSQYIGASIEGKNSGALDYLFAHLINKVFSQKKYFSFGISNENEGKDINYGLNDWKEGFGARTICHNFYEIDPENYKLLEKFMH